MNQGSAASHLSQMLVSELSDLCRAETANYLRQACYDETWCFELFRRAVAGQDAQAWAAVIAQYRRFVLGWVRQHPARSAVNEEDEDWVNGAFARFWKARPPESFALFPNLAAILRYLKMCVHSLLMDETRGQPPLEDITTEGLGDEAADADVETATLDALTAPQVWQVIEQEVQDEAERQVVYLSFALELSPGEIQQQRPLLFPTVAEVYRVKRNVIHRLRRSPQLQALLG